MYTFIQLIKEYVTYNCWGVDSSVFKDNEDNWIENDRSFV